MASICSIFMGSVGESTRVGMASSFFVGMNWSVAYFGGVSTSFGSCDHGSKDQVDLLCLLMVSYIVPQCLQHLICSVLSLGSQLATDIWSLWLKSLRTSSLCWFWYEAPGDSSGEKKILKTLVAWCQLQGTGQQWSERHNWRLNELLWQMVRNWKYSKICVEESGEGLL